MIFHLSLYVVHNVNLKSYALKELLNSLRFGLAEAFSDSDYANS